MDTAIRSLLHFLVDGTCVCSLYLVADSYGMERLLGIFLAYNVMAFLTQPLTGYVADRTTDGSRMLFTAVGLLCGGSFIVAIATAFGVRAEWTEGLVFLAAVILGAGNSLFHVWGGKATAVESDNDIRQLGVFVATGAMGLAVGVVFASWILLVALIVGLAMLAVSVSAGATEATGPTGTTEATEITEATETTELTGTAEATGKVEATGKAIVLPLPSLWVVGAMLLIIVVVMLRSLIGQTFISGGLKSLTLLVGLTAMLGKMAGGWMSHYMGLVPAIIVMVLAVVICLAWPGNSVVMMLSGLFAVNCTMPVTLYLANVLMPGKEGLAFGLLAAALMPGYLLATMNNLQ